MPNLNTKLSSLRICISSGETLSPSLVNLFHATLPGRKLVNLYGSTEVAGDVTFHVTCPRENQLYSVIGKPIANVQLYVLDEEMRQTNIGQEGELFVGGLGLSIGYLNDKSLTSNRFISTNSFSNSRLFRTGDLVKYNPDGNLVFLGRRDNQVKVRGFRVNLEEVESVILLHPLVDKAVAVLWENGGSNNRLICYVQGIKY